MGEHPHDSVGDQIMSFTSKGMESCEVLQSDTMTDVQVARQAVKSRANGSACCESSALFYRAILTFVVRSY